MLIGPKELLQSLTLTHAWFANWSFIQASWSISVEFLFYLLFPLLLFMRYGAVTAILVFLAGASLYAGVHTGIMPFPPELRPHSVHFVFFYGSFFPLGMAVFFATRRFAILRRLLDNNWAFLALLGAILASPLLPGQYYLGLLVFTVPLLIRAAHTATLSARLIGNPLMVFLGELSYALYLSHQLIYGLVSRLAEHVPADPVYIWSSNYLLLLIWSYLCYRIIELPARQGMRAMWHIEHSAQRSKAK